MRVPGFYGYEPVWRVREDLTRARRISYIDWYDGVLPVICKQE